jgi:hypothetical protein
MIKKHKNNKKYRINRALAIWHKKCELSLFGQTHNNNSPTG